jgi:hypothetical protein
MCGLWQEFGGGGGGGGGGRFSFLFLFCFLALPHLALFLSCPPHVEINAHNLNPVVVFQDMGMQCMSPTITNFHQPFALQLCDT